MRTQLENLHKRAITDLEAEENLRAKFEKRKTHDLRMIIEDEERRIRDYQKRLREDIDRKEQELKEWREK